MSDHVNDRLRAAVGNVEPPPYLGARVRNQIRTSDKSTPLSPRFFAATALALVCFGVTGYLGFKDSAQESYIANASSPVASIMRVGLGDHIHCSVFRKYPKDAPSAEQVIAAMTPEFRGLIPLVKEHVPSDCELMTAHQCRYHLRPFTHLAFRKGSSLMSLVIATKRDGESFETATIAPALRESGIPLYQAGADKFQIAAFETDKYIVYVISDFPREGNSETMAALAPGVRDFLGRM